MRYAKIREMDISNGDGIGVSLFVQGCHFHCHGCFNPETWDFSEGKDWNEEIKAKFLSLAQKNYIRRISILGGEPLCDENVEDVLDIIKSIKKTFPEKHIWLYTGYNFDEIIMIGNTTEQTFWRKRLDCILMVDVVIDGQFQLKKQDIYNKKNIWAGSTNQRVIKVAEFMKNTIFL